MPNGISLEADESEWMCGWGGGMAVTTLTTPQTTHFLCLDAAITSDVTGDGSLIFHL